MKVWKREPKLVAKCGRIQGRDLIDHSVFGIGVASRGRGRAEYFLVEETSLTSRAKIHDFATAQADEEARAKMAAGMQMQQDCWTVGTAMSWRCCQKWGGVHLFCLVKGCFLESNSLYVWNVPLGSSISLTTCFDWWGSYWWVILCCYHALTVLPAWQTRISQYLSAKENDLQKMQEKQAQQQEMEDGTHLESILFCCFPQSEGHSWEDFL